MLAGSLFGGFVRGPSSPGLEALVLSTSSVTKDVMISVTVSAPPAGWTAGVGVAGAGVCAEQFTVNEDVEKKKKKC